VLVNPDVPPAPAAPAAAAVPAPAAEPADPAVAWAAVPPTPPIACASAMEGPSKTIAPINSNAIPNLLSELVRSLFMYRPPHLSDERGGMN
jgi:hypothetical protein